MSTELLALAEWCEAATGADRLLDYLIRAAIGKGVRLTDAVRVSPASESGYETVHYANGGVSQGSMPPAYTASLDAAMGLVPERWVFTLFNRFDGTATAQLGPQGDSYGKRVEADAATPALALAAAALRARAAEGGAS